MSHPDKYGVGLIALPMMAVVLIAIIATCVLVCVRIDRVPRPRRSRLAFWVGLAVVIPLWLGTFPVSPRVSRDLAVIASFGWDAYADGLRVVNKHGQLSDGRFLSTFWSAAMEVGCVALDFVWVIPVMAWIAYFHPQRPPDPCDDPAGEVGQPAASGRADQSVCGDGAARTLMDGTGRAR